MNRRIYADYAAAAPLCGRAKQTITALFELYGNPSAGHREGFQARELVERARGQIAAAINAAPEEIFFTSGGSESNALALQVGWGIQASPIEHASILNNKHTKTGIIQVDRKGTIQPFTAAYASIMLVNNEVGTIQPVGALAAGGQEQEGVLRFLHVDAVQAVGHIPVDVKALGADMLSMSGHKFGAPKGVGALYVNRKRVNTKFLQSLIPGGNQESGLRAGTENVMGIAAMGAAIEWAAENMEVHAAHIKPLRDKLIDGIAAIRGAELTGHPFHRAPGIASFVIKGVEGQALAAALDEDGIAVSAGSACHSGSLRPSHVLLAMGYEPELALGALRVSIGWETSEDDVNAIIRSVRQRVGELRQ